MIISEEILEYVVLAIVGVVLVARSVDWTKSPNSSTTSLPITSSNAGGTPMIRIKVIGIKTWNGSKTFLQANWKSLLALVIAYLLVLYFFPITRNSWKSSVVWINIVSGILLWSMYDEKKKGLPTTATILLSVLVITNLAEVGRWIDRTFIDPPTETTITRPMRYATPLPSNWHPTLLRPKEAEGKDTEVVRKFWDSHPHPNITVDEMIVICRNESGCNQRNADGTVVRNHNQNGAKDDLGVMQINEGWWAKEVLQQKALDIDLSKVDINTIKGNLDAALHLRTRYGLSPWTQQKFHESWIVEAPVGKWGNVVITPRDRSMTCRPDPDTSVKVLVNGEREEIYIPGTPLNLGGGIITKQFQSPDKKAVTILCSLE